MATQKKTLTGGKHGRIQQDIMRQKHGCAGDRISNPQLNIAIDQGFKKLARVIFDQSCNLGKGGIQDNFLIFFVVLQ